ncbi:SOS response-associated peptidase [Roseococcus sp. DSY-14]|uniref:SOS response-associated peptidase n=1 Tax=Roseococcus sp. DSY-14 TaxID=3369650 RepID=UPI00387B0A62
MCGRYLLHRPNAEIAAYFDVGGPVPNHGPSYNIAPTQASLVVRHNPQDGQRHLDALQWGLVPYWSKDAKGGARMINARADGVAQKPAFREAFRRRRCLVPMDGFYEWKAMEGRRQPYLATMADGSPMAAAGLWEGWKAEDGSWLRTYSIITTDAAGRQALLHHRMPVLLPRAAWPAWLGEREAAPEALQALLTPLDDALLAFRPVHPRVGKVSENDPALLEPYADAPPIEGLMTDAPG